MALATIVVQRKRTNVLKSDPLPHRRHHHHHHPQPLTKRHLLSGGSKKQGLSIQRSIKRDITRVMGILVHQPLHLSSLLVPRQKIIMAPPPPKVLIVLLLMLLRFHLLRRQNHCFKKFLQLYNLLSRKGWGRRRTMRLLHMAKKCYFFTWQRKTHHSHECSHRNLETEFPSLQQLPTVVLP